MNEVVLIQASMSDTNQLCFHRGGKETLEIIYSNPCSSQVKWHKMAGLLSRLYWLSSRYLVSFAFFWRMAGSSWSQHNQLVKPPLDVIYRSIVLCKVLFPVSLRTLAYLHAGFVCNNSTSWFRSWEHALKFPTATETTLNLYLETLKELHFNPKLPWLVWPYAYHHNIMLISCASDSDATPSWQHPFLTKDKKGYHSH